MKTRREGAKIAALLDGYQIMQVEEAGDQSVVVIRAKTPFYYTALQREKHAEGAIEWALKTELGRDCQVRLVSASPAL